MKKSIIDIDLRTESFQRFQTLFGKYQQALAQTPGMWARAGEAQSHLTPAFARQTAALMAQSQLAREAAKADETQAKHLRQSEHLWTSMARSTKSVAGNIISATSALLRWTGVLSAVGGLLGAGGLFGIDRMAASVSNQRRTGMGLGMSPGEMQAFSINFGRIVDPDSFLEKINEARANPGEAWRLATLGVSTAGSTSDVAVRALDAMRARALATPESQLGFLDSQTRMDQGVDVWRRLHDMSREEYAAQRAHYAQDVISFATSPGTNRALQDLSTQFHRSGTTLFDAFQTRIGQLAPDLTNLSDKLTKLGTKIIDSPLAQDAVTAVGHGLDWLAGKLGSPEFQEKVERLFSKDGPIATAAHEFSDGVRRFTTEVGEDLPAISKVLHALLHPLSDSTPWSSYLGKSFENLSNWLSPNPTSITSNIDSYRDYLSRLDRHFDLPGGLLEKVFQAESSSNLYPKKSPKGAIGAFQFMPGVATAEGFDPNDPVQSANHAGKLLAQYRDKYDDLGKVLAANNWGPAKLDALLRFHPNDWLSYAGADGLPAETRDYIGKIGGDDPEIRKQLQRYNLNVSMKAVMADMEKDWQRSTQESLRANISSIFSSLQSKNSRQLGIAVTVNNNTGGDATVAVSQLAH
jgi:transglycosylase-like protein with SLT domain